MKRKSGNKMRRIICGEVRDDTLECMLEYMEVEQQTIYTYGALGARDQMYFIQDIMEAFLDVINYKIPGGKLCSKSKTQW